MGRDQFIKYLLGSHFRVTFSGHILQTFAIEKISYILFGTRFFVLSMFVRFFYAVNIGLLFYLFTHLLIYIPVRLIKV